MVPTVGYSLTRLPPATPRHIVLQWHYRLARTHEPVAPTVWQIQKIEVPVVVPFVTALTDYYEKRWQVLQT
jgi:hypothetical protein